MTQLETLSKFFDCALGEIQRVVRETQNDTDGEPTMIAEKVDLKAHLIPTDDLAVHLPAEAIHSAVERLLETCNLYHLTAITAIDDGERIELKYHFWQGHGLTLETALPADNAGTHHGPTIPTITDIIPGAAFYEREIYGMFDVTFDGHPELRPLLLPDDWQGGPPLRKDSSDG
ncbi:MAG: NADH-quinone oxidoreductase subunit C [Anaerolineae bacterium]|nr:NADH-quinone oxidoreductase subunit C [Anaerolineae bacterium]